MTLVVVRTTKTKDGINQIVHSVHENKNLAEKARKLEENKFKAHSPASLISGSVKFEVLEEGLRSALQYGLIGAVGGSALGPKGALVAGATGATLGAFMKDKSYHDALASDKIYDKEYADLVHATPPGTNVAWDTHKGLAIVNPSRGLGIFKPQKPKAAVGKGSGTVIQHHGDSSGRWISVMPHGSNEPKQVHYTELTSHHHLIPETLKD